MSGRKIPIAAWFLGALLGGCAGASAGPIDDPSMEPVPASPTGTTDPYYDEVDAGPFSLPEPPPEEPTENSNPEAPEEPAPEEKPEPKPPTGPQHTEANIYAHWNFGGGDGFWNVDQLVRVDQKAKETFFSQLWNWRGASYGGYVGLQTDGIRFNGTRGDTAIFSLWNANAAAGPSCGEFGGEGTGYSCRLAYPFVQGRFYRLRTWRGSKDGGGQWWMAYIRDESTGTETHIGSIRVAGSHRDMNPPSNFVEYFGTKVACGSVPTSVAIFTPPAANQTTPGAYAHYS
ncbi:MAG: DUF3472 domain-containing protein, partial [Myxococcales bacterium]|nr:DUF3472 domain-containing protein [Myxococcales bacterium]